MNIFKMMFMSAWTALCIVLAIRGYAGRLDHFYSGLGWTILVVLNVIILYAFYKMEKLLDEAIDIFEKFKENDKEKK